MDVLLQVHGAKRVFPLPEGLKELSSDIVREVLRHQPECIHGFIAEYLETMLMVREKARDCVQVVNDAYQEGYFYESLFRTKKVTREMAAEYATRIQAAWRGYVVRKKIRAYLEKKRRIQEEKEMREEYVITEYLNSIGITYEEATRAACIIQRAYRKLRSHEKAIYTDTIGESRIKDDDVPFIEKVREEDKALGRYDRWDKKHFGDFFELDSVGKIKYKWPRVGQIFRLPKNLVKPDMEIIEFFAMKDFEGHEQYSYLKAAQPGENVRGFPIGFLIPLQRVTVQDNTAEVEFVQAHNNYRMGPYTFVFDRAIETQDLEKFKEILEDRNAVISKGNFDNEFLGEFEYDPNLVLPRLLIQTQRKYLLKTDDEVRFLNKLSVQDVDLDTYTFRAENVNLSLKVIDYILKNPCGSMEEALELAGNIADYTSKYTGRLLLVQDFESPTYVQKVIIHPETKTGSYENQNLDNYDYVFVPRHYKWEDKKCPIPENPIRIPLTRFHGYRSYFTGSRDVEDMVFIMGPMIRTPDGKHFTPTSIWWNQFGLEAWYSCLCDIATRKIRKFEQGEKVKDDEESSEEGCKFRDGIDDDKDEEKDDYEEEKKESEKDEATIINKDEEMGEQEIKSEEEMDMNVVEVEVEVVKTESQPIIKVAEETEVPPPIEEPQEPQQNPEDAKPVEETPLEAEPKEEAESSGVVELEAQQDSIPKDENVLEEKADTEEVEQEQVNEE